MAREFSQAVLSNNPAWVQLLGLCPLLAVSNSVVNALALSTASAFVLIGSNVLISSLRKVIPDFARLPMFVLIIATFTTLTTMVLEAFAYTVYLKIALFVQIIVTNCMILGRAESFASHNGVVKSLLDALGTATGFAIALLTLGFVREALGQGTLFTDLHVLLGVSQSMQWVLTEQAWFPIAQYAPGAFIIAGLALALFLRPDES